MYGTIELEGNEAEGADDVLVLGWRVSISERVRNLCVKVPPRAEGLTEEGQLHDFLTTLRVNLGGLPALVWRKAPGAFVFSVRVPGKRSRRRNTQGGRERPGPDVPLAAFTGFDLFGRPRLVVLALSEARARLARPAKG